MIPRRVAAACALVLAVGGLAPAQAAVAPAPRVLVDDFEDPSPWKAQPADGVELRIGSDAGVHGHALRLDVNFTRGSGYAVAHRAVSIDLPANYRFSFAVRGQIPPEDLEFKLIDSTGANVWWMNRRGFVYPVQWDSLLTRKRQIEFAWGPAGGGELRHVSAIEVAITAGKGGRGTVWLDDLTLEPLPPSDAPPPAVVRHPTPDGEVFDFGVDRELSGIAIDWPARLPGPARFAVERSDDGARWTRVREALRAPGGHNEIHMPETATRFVRLRGLASEAPRASGPGGSTPAALHACTMRVRPWSWAPTTNAFFAQLAKAARRGAYPRSYLGEQSYWTILGDDPGLDEALIDEDGRIEPWKGGPSIEPLLQPAGAAALSWARGRAVQRLPQPGLPIAAVERDASGTVLDTHAFVAGDDSAACLYATYTVTAGKQRLRGDLVLALRPFQVNAPTQFLNGTGGACEVRRIAREGGRLRLDDRPAVRLVTPPDAVELSAFDAGDPVERAVTGPRSTHAMPPSPTVIVDPAAHATALVRYALDLAPGASRVIHVVVPLARDAAPDVPDGDAYRSALARWSPAQDAPRIELPKAAHGLENVLRQQLAWARVTKDEAALKPGARAYDRSWIRDGVLAADAFLRMGDAKVARDFARWFAGFVAEDGAVPCCVDARGPDPTPEHDSHGEFIFLVAEIARYTGDLELPTALWPAVRRAALHIDALREQRRTAEWRTPANAPFFGLLPPSISHEGYSAKPMHSYWDDLWAWRGLCDAAELARRLRQDADARAFAASRDTFAADLARSVRAAMAHHRVDYVPGCADLGDFDATSTTIALDPVGARALLPDSALERTFERYWRFFAARRSGKEKWDAYTPYELRTVGAMVRLGWRDRAADALEWFEEGLRPRGFAEWAEVVDRDPRHARFIGDMPHTWVGTDGVRSMLDLLAYTDPADSALVLAAGVPWRWFTGRESDAAVHVERLATPFGPLGYALRPTAGGSFEVRIDEGLRVPPGGLRVCPPSAPGRPWRSGSVNDAPTPVERDGSIVVRAVPAQVEFRR